MFATIITSRIESLVSLHKDIEGVLRDMEMEAVDKDGQEVRQRFVSFSKELQRFVLEYKESLELFVKEKPSFTFDEYQSSFADKDNEINVLLNEYMHLRTKLSE